ncbi:hypothetical protein N7495_009753 [Penicillium taxi]|uniref:uncharacterized protein n=1 Tax=Penicillium taxi TaxID=168475 RepID=UPI0025453342|nr:uncharacterized protein N7495_009753 [Penicillium taxi]KAJ5885243.1 hypothetical protein N7495_009753 [Penicillium taxi]
MDSVNYTQNRPRKRRRRTMACTQCRSRKLKCDREYPSCSRCLKSRTPTECTYEDGFLWQQPTTVAVNRNVAAFASYTAMPRQSTPDSGLVVPPTRSDALVSTMSGPGPATDGNFHRHKERGFLETVLGAPKAAVSQEPYVNPSFFQRRDLPEQGTSTQVEEKEYYPLSPSQQLDISPELLYEAFPDIRPFAEEIRLSNPILSRVRPELERVTHGLWRLKLSEPFPDPTVASLVALFPSRAVADELIGLYLTYIESTSRILHVPTFLQEVELFWSNVNNPSLIKPSLIVQLLLVFSIAWSLSDISSLQEKSPVLLKCYTAVEWVLHAEKWIKNTQVKRAGIDNLRLNILLIIAQNIQGAKRSQAWMASGQLVRTAMMAGYHRDPAKYAHISVFNKEMRRRIWMTIVELDLQIAIDRGLPPSIQVSEYDTIPALNINDDELQEDSMEAPENRPRGDITDCSFSATLAQSLPLRLKVCHLMHSPRIRCRYEEIQSLNWELSRHIAQIPTWNTTDADLVTHQKVILRKAMIETKLAQSLLSVHTPFAIEAGREVLFAPSARSCLDAAVMILSTQKRMYETSQALSLCMVGEWTLHSFISVCQALHAFSTRADLQNSLSSTFLLHTLSGLPNSLMSLVEVALLSLEDRFLLVMKGAKDYFFLSTIQALVKAKLWPDQAKMHKLQVVERVLSFAQTLFSRHATCEHLGTLGMGSFANNQVAAFLSTSDLNVISTEMDGLPSSLGFSPPGDIDPFLGAFNWEDLMGFVLSD